MASYDIIGSIAIIKPKIRKKVKTKSQKLKEAKELLKKPSIKTVLEKASDVEGRLRKIKTKFIAGEKNLITIYNENNCRFKLNVQTCYFSPRLSNDRKQTALGIKKSDKVLVMFAGVGVYPIVIYKLAKPKEITAIEISKECNKYFKENLKLNKIPEGKIKLIQGDVKKKIYFPAKKEKFDFIMMARPNLKETFFKEALKVSRSSTKIFYHGFCRENELNKLKENLINQAKSSKRKIKIIKVIKAGEIAPYKFRYRLEIKVLR